MRRIVRGPHGHGSGRGGGGGGRGGGAQQEVQVRVVFGVVEVRVPSPRRARP